MPSQYDVNTTANSDSASFLRETHGISKRTYLKYLRALNRLKWGSESKTYQAVADGLSATVTSGKPITKAEVWKMMHGRVWSKKICDALCDAGHVEPRKRYRLHVEFSSGEERQKIISWLGIGEGRSYSSFSEWFMNWYNYEAAEW